jgi:hypothetical protein
MKPKMTPAQRERQTDEYRKNGKYAKVNPCQGCGKSAGVNYFSHRMTDNMGWGDSALVLCKKCSYATDDIQDVKEFYAYQKLNGGGK